MQDSCVFHRRLDRTLPQAVKAQGVWIEDADGKRYLDASGGPICVNVGHGRSEVVRAISKQAETLDYVHGTMFTTKTLEDLARRLAGHAPEGIDLFYFISSGSEAVETSLKLARQVHLAAGRSSRYRPIARWQSYHGSTLGALSATGRTGMRKPFTPMLAPFIHIPPPYCLRCHFGLKYPQCGLRCAHVLDEVIRLEGAETISAFLAETICGATLAAVTPPPEYYPIVAQICKQHGVLFILDEVMCGLGRTGRWFASEHYQVEPDMMILGKGLGGGYVPLSAVGCKREHLEEVRKQAGSFVHGHTYSHHAVAAAAGLAVVDIMERENLIELARERGSYLEKLLEPLKDHPHVGDVRGIGLMRGIELVKDKKNLTPFPRKEKVIEQIYDKLMDSGIITYKCIGFAGGDGDALMLGPPFIIQEGELDLMVTTVEKVINEVLS